MVLRDDSILYTGVTSVSSGRHITAREVQREAKEKASSKLAPAAEVVLAEIAQEKATVLDLRSFVIDRTTTEQEVNTELLARKLYLSYLTGLEAKIKHVTTVRQPRKRREAEADDE